MPPGQPMRKRSTWHHTMSSMCMVDGNRPTLARL